MVGVTTLSPFTWIPLKLALAAAQEASLLNPTSEIAQQAVYDLQRRLAGLRRPRYSLSNSRKHSITRESALSPQADERRCILSPAHAGC